MRDYTKMRIPSDFIENVIRPSAKGNGKIISAFESVPREYFMEEAMHFKAYSDNALPIGFGQTISQPSLVAMMIAELEPDKSMKCLEVGAGSGYVSGLLGKLFKDVYAVEIVDELAVIAQKRLRSMMIWNVQVISGNGALGFPEKAPYERILVSAGANSLPEALLDQLADDGIMIIPLEGTLTKIVKNNGNISQDQLARVAFVNFRHT